MRRVHSILAHRWTVSLAVLGLTALLAGCGVSAHARATTTTTNSPTATRPALSHLDWQPMNMPPQASVTPYTLGFAPSDGDVVYACTVDAHASSQQLHLWITRDRSAHWTHLTDLTVHAGSTTCGITVDEWQPMTAVVAVNWAPMGASPEVSSFASYATLDGGTSWRQLTGPHPYIVRQLATMAGVTYAELSILPASGEVDEIASSADGLRTWQPLPQTQSFGVGEDSSGFWLDPKNGALLVEGMTAAGVVLWRSDDRGTHWTALSTPASLTDPSVTVVVQMPQAGTWHLCIATSPDNGRTPSNSLTCSLDGGETWTPRPGLSVAFSNSVKGTFYATAAMFALDDAGAVLATITLPDVTNSTLGTSFYRLSPQARQWQRIGGFSGEAFPVGMYPTPSGEVLWADGEPVIGESSQTQGWHFAPYP
ncbi:MAG TPA: sialidase family protein [Ktedonobacterales bacterium]|nr:sialidase family protein [Ktedonobacterales bacterium]